MEQAGWHRGCAIDVTRAGGITGDITVGLAPNSADGITNEFARGITDDITDGITDGITGDNSSV